MTFDGDWKKFAKSIGGKLVRVEGDAACIEWPGDTSLPHDDAWFSVNMATKIIKAIQRSKS